MLSLILASILCACSKQKPSDPKEAELVDLIDQYYKLQTNNDFSQESREKLIDLQDKLDSKCDTFLESKEQTPLNRLKLQKQYIEKYLPEYRGKLDKLIESFEQSQK